MGRLKICFILMVFVLGGCTYAAKPMTNDQIDKVDRVGIVTIIGKEFSYGYLGVTTFGNYEKLYPQEYLDYDKEVRSILSSAIIEKTKNNPNPIEVVPVEYDFNMLTSSYKKEGKFEEFKIESIANELNALGEKEGLNYFVVVTRGHNAIANGAGSMGGIGISKTAYMKEKIMIHNYLDYKLYEVSTGKVPTFFSTSAMNFGQKRDVEFPWKEPLKKYSNKGA